jgi:valyl-tRNA synthetase
MTEPLSAQYDPAQIEAALYREWEERGYFHARADRVLNDDADPYVIVIPPPNVTAVLHMGHGLNNTIQDVLIRWRRMQGREYRVETRPARRALDTPRAGDRPQRRRH